MSQRACERARVAKRMVAELSAGAGSDLAMADGGAERADGRIVKMEVDYSATVDQRLPECEQMAQVRPQAPPRS